jgi:hypothetical protein
MDVPSLEQVNLIQLLVNGGFAALAVFLVVENRKDSQRREEASQRREDALMRELGEERQLRAAFQSAVTAQFQAVADTLKRIEQRIEAHS